MAEWWTDRSNRVRKAAKEQRCKDGAAALLLALLGEPTSAAVAVLKRLSINTDELRSKVEGLINLDSPPREPLPSIGEVESAAGLEAAALRHRYIGTEHLLLAITKSGHGTASEALAAMRVYYPRALSETLRLLCGEPDEQKTEIKNQTETENRDGTEDRNGPGQEPARKNGTAPD